MRVIDSTLLINVLHLTKWTSEGSQAIKWMILTRDKHKMKTVSHRNEISEIEDTFYFNMQCMRPICFLMKASRKIFYILTCKTSPDYWN